MGANLISNKRPTAARRSFCLRVAAHFAVHESAYGPKLLCDQRRPMSDIEGFSELYFSGDRKAGIYFTKVQCPLDAISQVIQRGPGHPLLDATMDLVLERYRDLLKRGALLVDDADDGEQPFWTSRVIKL
jgi:hypothetical protein